MPRLQLDDVMTTIEIDTPAGRIDGLLDLPVGEGPWPGVVVIHDGFGYGPDKRRSRIASRRQAIWHLLRICTLAAGAPNALPG